MIDDEVMVVPMFHVDAFTDTPFAGNPAAVCLLDGPGPEAWMQLVAAEINLPETAFVWPVPPGRWGLRWWTPTVEVPLCGHATLASAHVLIEEGQAGAGETLRFLTASGELTARGLGDTIELDFPAYERRSLSADEEATVRSLIGADAGEVVGYGPKLLARLASRAEVEAVRPDLVALRQLPYEGLIVTADSASATPGYVLRFFAPALGIDEDPVTGSAQCAAGPYWRECTGVAQLAAEQVSARGPADRDRRRRRPGGDRRASRHCCSGVPGRRS